jgi:hypothetical protein
LGLEIRYRFFSLNDIMPSQQIQIGYARYTGDNYYHYYCHFIPDFPISLLAEELEHGSL